MTLAEVEVEIRPLDKAIAEASDPDADVWRYLDGEADDHRSATPDTLSEKPGLDVDFAAMRNVEAMLSTYLSPEDAARASNDVVAKLRLGGFVISRSGSTDSEGGS